MVPALRFLFVLLLLGGLGHWTSAQKINETFQYPLHRASAAVVIDGVTDEAAWQAAPVADHFRMVLPMDTSQATVRTDVRMLYDDRFVYISAVCYRHQPGARYLVESLRRDWNFGRNDNFIFFLDTFDDLTNGFTFGVNAAGAQWDGLLYEGSRANLSWDNKWASAVRNFDDRWEFEAAIPFKTLRYKKGVTRWGVNFSRQDLQTTEKSAWAPVPRQFPTASLAYTGLLVWDEAPPTPGPNISLIPYALGGLARDYRPGARTDFRRDVGLDAKVAVTSALNLDLTVNPDFSQVDVDQQVTNLDRFELFFPERRQFFQENADQFTNFGTPTIRPFFSRRIGLGGVPIRFGARLSGKLNKDWRLGAMDMQTGAVPSGTPTQDGLPAHNFAVLALQRRVAARSNVGVLFVNKQAIGYRPVNDVPTYSAFNRNLGLEYNLASANNLWTGKALVLKSFSPGRAGNDFVVLGNLNFTSRRWQLSGQAERVGQNYVAEAGYVPRRGYTRGLLQAGYTFFPTGGRVLSHGPLLSSVVFWDGAGRQSDHESYASYLVIFRSRATLVGWVADDYVRLLAPFDPTNSGRDPLVAGTEHRWGAWGTEFTSKPQSVFTYGFRTRYGGYYAGGTRLNLTTDLGYRFQPYVALAANLSYNDIRLPQGRTQFWLISPRFDLTLTNTLYLTTFVQYNEQQRNMNLNARLQWRYRPASDLFFVYTDNYLPNALAQPGQDIPGLFSVKNRALVLKWTYWWNL